MTAKESEGQLKSIAEKLLDCVGDMVRNKPGVAFTQDPELVEKDIIEYESRMRVFGMEKFNGPCVVSAVNYYLSSKDLDGHDAHGGLVVYIEGEESGRLLKAMGNKFDEDDEEALLEHCGKFCKMIAEEFKGQLSSLGYGDLVISEPLSYKNDIAEGIEFKYSETKYYEVSFYIWKQKTLAVCITLAPPA